MRFLSFSYQTVSLALSPTTAEKTRVVIKTNEQKFHCIPLYFEARDSNVMTKKCLIEHTKKRLPSVSDSFAWNVPKLPMTMIRPFITKREKKTLTRSHQIIR